jgi:hypothetical protein
MDISLPPHCIASFVGSERSTYAVSVWAETTDDCRPYLTSEHVAFVQRGDVFRFEATNQLRGRAWFYLNVECPQHLSLSVSASNSALEIINLEGPLTLYTQHGRALIADCSGSCLVEARPAGFIAWTGSRGSVSLAADLGIDCRFTDLHYRGLFSADCPGGINVFVPAHFRNALQARTCGRAELQCAQHLLESGSSREEALLFHTDIPGLSPVLRLQSLAAGISIVENGSGLN